MYWIWFFELWENLLIIAIRMKHEVVDEPPKFWLMVGILSIQERTKLVELMNF